MNAIAFDWRNIAMSSIARTKPPRPSAMSGLVKRVWLLLYAEGGRWNAAEIKARLHVPGEIHTTLREMAERGFLIRGKLCDIDGECSMRYGVTSKCKVPRGVAIEEIQAALRAPEPLAA